MALLMQRGLTFSLRDIMWATEGQLDEGKAAAAAPELEVGTVGSAVSQSAGEVGFAAAVSFGCTLRWHVSQKGKVRSGRPYVCRAAEDK